LIWGLILRGIIIMGLALEMGVLFKRNNNNNNNGFGP
jgi:hypothetical protein